MDSFHGLVNFQAQKCPITFHIPFLKLKRGAFKSHCKIKTMVMWGCYHAYHVVHEVSQCSQLFK